MFVFHKIVCSLVHLKNILIIDNQLEFTEEMGI